MVARIELYCGTERKLFGTVPLMPVVRLSLMRILGRRLDSARIRLVLINVPDDSSPAGTPSVMHLVPEFGYAYVKVYEGGMLVYQHPHPVSDIIAEALQLILKRRYADETSWAFRLDVPGMEKVTSNRPTPRVEGDVLVRSYADGESPGFTIRRITEEAPPARMLADFDVRARRRDDASPVKMLLHASLQEDLCRTRPLSLEVEEGGFLTGRVYRDGEREGAYLLEVTAAVPAEYTGASFLHFTFTGDSFTDIKRTLQQQRPGERLLGWYHTHLFPATSDFGLSSVDLALHFGTFTIPWQIAGLINVSDGERTLRFYAPLNNDMVLCPCYVINERYTNSSGSY